ncbi:MAG: mechanosensitive ion channel protein [Aequorivita sp.]|mgnify:CR=1 FL=1|nr:mechanosensitive ion channel protein [Aequorivita sp.]|tara:strand:+ start:121 stop:1044 length:924 start_codon:yes stop_codon:yes gene_type:complete
MITPNYSRWIIISSVLAVLLIAVHYLLDLKSFEVLNEYNPLLKRLSLSLFLMALIFLISQILSKIVNKQSHIEGEKYNLLRIIKFFTIAFILIILASFLFQNLYAAAVSFGLISLVIGFALQAPITSFIAWVYLVFRKTYLVGDRIQIKGFRGDVVEISYLDTSILECHGDYLGNDRASGRIVRFPNSLILREEVINYSGHDKPFIWNETVIQIAYTSELEFVKSCLIEAATRDFKEKYPKLTLKNNVHLEPTVYFRNNKYAWMEAVVSYPVEPLDTTGRRNRILSYALPLLNKHPEKAKLPDGIKR